ncbi:MAG: iron uptake porin [Limnothrix sp. BL-A-16]
MLKSRYGILMAALAISGGAMLGTADRAAAESPVGVNASTEATLLGSIDSEMALDQVTSVSQLSDVQPTDWAFQALQSLVERYGCIAGYPDGTFKGNRPLSRYEFAAGLNACLDRINDLIKAATDPLATKEDLRKLQKLQEEFAAELAALRGRVDSLEARTSELEANQFSTTTKLSGQVIFGMQGGTLTGDDSDDSGAENVTFSQRTRLLLVTSFTGKDKLFTRLESNSVRSPLNDVTGLTNLSYGNGSDTNFRLTFLAYEFPLSDRATAIVGQDLLLEDAHPVHTPLYGGGNGAISAFADLNPIYRQPTYGGAGIRWRASDNFTVAALYSAGNSASPDEGRGLFDGSYSASVSLNYTSSNDRFSAGLLYAHSYYSRVDRPFNVLGGSGTKNTFNLFNGDSFDSDNIGFQTQYRFSEHFGMHGFFGYTWADSLNNDDANADILTWGVGFTFPDLGKEGSMGALTVGQPPTVVNADGVEEDDNTPILVEAMYKFALNDNIYLTPGVVAVFDANDNGDTAVMGVLRTEFKF